MTTVAVWAAKGRGAEARSALDASVREVEPGEVSELLEALDASTLLVVWEPGGLLGEIARRAPRVAVAPLGGEVAAALGVDATSKALEKLQRAARKGRLSRSRVECVRVSVSDRPAAVLGWTVALGSAAQLVSAGPQALVRVLGGERGVFGEAAPEVKLVLDGEPSSPVTWGVFGTLERTSLGVALDGRGLRLRSGTEAVELVKAIARSRAPLAALRGVDEALGLQFADLTGLTELVVDGVSIPVSPESVVRVRGGERVEFATV